MGIDAIIAKQSDGSWLFTWSPGTPPYSIWLDGVWLEEGILTETYTYEEDDYPDSPPALEILSDGDISENQNYPPIFVLQWLGNLNANGYVVEQYVDSSWVEKHYREENGAGLYSWTTPALDDNSAAQWRVRAIDDQGNKGTAITFSFDVARNPSPPDVVFEFDSSGNIVVEEA